MGLKSKGNKSIGLQGVVRKRDKAFDQLAFNEKYLTVAERMIDDKQKKQIDLFRLASQKKLYPLEQAAMPPGVVYEARRQEALDALVEKQRMPCRAIQQSALRKAKKSGEAAGEAYRKEKLGALDAKLEAYKAELLAKYPESDAAPSAEAVTRYETAQKEEDQKLQTLLAQCEADKKSQLEKLGKKLAERNKKYQAIFESTNQRLGALYGGEAGEFGDDTVMRVQNVKMYFSGIKAVDDLSFDIKEGEIFGLIGPNGAGKSTLFNCITQFYKATSGTIYYRDKFNNIIDLSHYKSHDVLKTGIARTFQNLEMVLNVSVLDNLLIGAHIYYHANLFHQFLQTKRVKDEERVNRALALDILERMQLLEYKDVPPAGLPYGVLKKIELARTLMTQPRLIILDEPAAGLNDVETEDLAEIIRQVRTDFNCTIILVEHDMNLVMNVCDTVCAISFGKKLAVGTPEEIQNSPLVQEAYLGEKEEVV